MPVNDQVLLAALVAERKQLFGSNDPDPDYFEHFVSEQVLKNYDLSYDELELGNIDGGNDGGTDRIYAFLDNELLKEDVSVDGVRRNAHLDLYLIQVKQHKGFAESPLLIVNQTIRDLLDMDRPLDVIASKYNARLIQIADQFRRTYQAVSTKFPNLSVHVYYASQGIEIHPNVAILEETFRKTLDTLFSSCDLDLRFLTAGDLVELYRRAASSASVLQLAETPISAEKDSFIGLVKLSDFHKFLSDESENLRLSLFESNVRDYAGDTEVNAAIAESLCVENSTEDFWWLNNGVTILATRASHASRKLTIEDAQIVNGLQTSFQIHEYFEHGLAPEDDRSVLVRVVVSTEAESRDRIIRATNSQTHIPVATLHATDSLQRSIEEYFGANGLYYERRKNHYKNMGRPRNLIVEITYLAQAVMAMVLGQPDFARARPTTLLKQQPDYESVFNKHYALDMYLTVARLMRLVDTFLRSGDAALSAADRNNLKYYVARCLVSLATERARPGAKEVATIDVTSINASLLAQALDTVRRLLEKVVSRNDFATDRIAKSPLLAKELDIFLVAELEPPAFLRVLASVFVGLASYVSVRAHNQQSCIKA